VAFERRPTTMLRDPNTYAQLMMNAAGVPPALRSDPKTSAFYVGVATAVLAAMNDADVGVETILYVNAAGVPTPCTGAAKLR
jgi:hypothetical protein